MHRARRTVSTSASSKFWASARNASGNADAKNTPRLTHPVRVAAHADEAQGFERSPAAGGQAKLGGAPATHVVRELVRIAEQIARAVDETAVCVQQITDVRRQRFPAGVADRFPRTSAGSPTAAAGPCVVRWR